MPRYGRRIITFSPLPGHRVALIALFNQGYVDEGFKEISYGEQICIRIGDHYLFTGADYRFWRMKILCMILHESS